jgi:hypothetical protein
LLYKFFLNDLLNDLPSFRVDATSQMLAANLK